VLQPGFIPALRSMSATTGVQVSLITPDVYQGKHFSASAFADMAPTFEVFPVPIFLSKRQGTFVYHYLALREALSTIRPDVLSHDQEIYTLGAGQIAAEASSRSIPLSMFVWENLARELSVPRRRLSKFVLNRCAGLIAGSSEAATVHRNLGFHGPIQVIPQIGVPSVDVSPVIGRRDPSQLQVMFGGRLVTEKGVDCLLRAISLLRKKNFPIHCTIAGDGPERSNLEQLVRSLNIFDAVTMAGSMTLPEVAGLLKRSDVLVLPSRRTKTWKEQLGHILLEAMAEATVTVGTRTGAIPEVIDSDSLLFDEDDHEGLARLLVDLAENTEFLKNQQRRLWQRANDLYLNDVLSRKRFEFFSSLVS
jgi:glycosyltransferase involved in cell wall biosynthesis